jgi:hypothetical protein
LNLGVLRLLRGDLAAGWPDYEARWPAGKVAARHFREPLWDGGPLDAKTILVHAEQGLGDTIQFSRYLPLLAERGGRMIFECQKSLVRLLSGWPGIAELIPQGEPLPPFDVQSPLLSLPGIFRTSLETIPVHVPYFFAAADVVEHFRHEFSAVAGRKIGIVWHGDPRQENNPARSIPLRCFEALAAIPGVQLVSLQKGSGAEQLKEVAGRFPVIEAGSRFNDFMDTAGAIMNLDMIIGCDTSVVHAAGALGAKVWVALSYVPDWRWLLERADCPWYPNMRLFRQQRPGDWPAVFEEIRAALEAGG